MTIHPRTHTIHSLYQLAVIVQSMTASWYKSNIEMTGGDPLREELIPQTGHISTGMNLQKFTGRFIDVFFFYWYSAASDGMVPLLCSE